MMERQISRIESAKDLRSVHHSMATQSEKGANEAIRTLQLEVGDTYEVDRPTYVKPDPKAGQKLNESLGRG
jgi:hypothetical protein